MTNSGLESLGMRSAGPSASIAGRVAAIGSTVLLKAYRERSRSCADYWRNAQRVDLATYNTNESADDLEDLRKAQGAKQISLWGISHGTHLALATLRRHPQSISHAILAGTEGPDHTYKLPGSIQHHLEDLSAIVKADQALGKEIPDVIGLMKSVFDELDKNPTVVEITDPRDRTMKLADIPPGSDLAYRCAAKLIAEQIEFELETCRPLFGTEPERVLDLLANPRVVVFSSGAFSRYSLTHRTENALCFSPPLWRWRA